MTTAYSNSQLQTYKDCPLQWRLYWDLHLRRMDDEISDHHLRYGAAIHEGLAVHYSGGTLREAQDAFLAGYSKQLNPDIVLEHLEHGGIWLMDHKTTGQYLNYRYWERFQPNSQITHYLDYAQSTYGPIEGFIINAIMFRFRERAYKGEPAGFWTAFERQVFNRNSSQLEYERLSRADWIADIERSKANGFFRTNTNSCYQCQFKGICAPGWTWEEDRELIEIQYRQVCDALLDHDYHCVLDLNHEGDCVPTLPETADLQIEIEV